MLSKGVLARTRNRRNRTLNPYLRKLGPLTVIGALLIGGTAGCERKDGGPSGATSSTGDIKIGAYGAVTGGQAAFGTSSRQGFQLAVDEANAKGGVLNRKIQLLFEDDASKAEDASTVVTKLVKQDQVVAVLGEVASSNSLAAAPICQSSKVPMVSPASTNEKVTQVGDYIFRVCFIDPFQGEVMAKFAANTLKTKKVAIMKDTKSDYSVGLTDTFTKAFQALGGTVTGVVEYSQGDTDFKAQLTTVKGQNPEAIFIPGYYQEAGIIVRQAREAGMEIPILGGDGWDSDPLFEVGGKFLKNCYYSTHYSTDNPAPAIQNFIKAFKTKYTVTPDANAALGYDAANVLLDAISRAGSTDGQKLRDALAATKNYSGVTGTMSLNAERNAVKPAVVIECKEVDGKMGRAFKETIEPGGATTAAAAPAGTAAAPAATNANTAK
jgi:branched-chain amino acid transport system substrate-binding protein